MQPFYDNFQFLNILGIRESGERQISVLAAKKDPQTVSGLRTAYDGGGSGAAVCFSYPEDHSQQSCESFRTFHNYDFHKYYLQYMVIIYHIHRRQICY